MTARCPYVLLAVLAACACVAGCERAQARASESKAPASESKAPAPESAAAASEPAASASESAAPAPASAPDPQAAQRRHVEQMRTAAKRNGHGGKQLARVQKMLRDLENSARAALPADATPEQVRAELEGNPKKYPAYRQLVLAAAESRTEMKNNYSQAQKSIRAYHMQRKVAEGRARGAATAEK